MTDSKRMYSAYTSILIHNPTHLTALHARLFLLIHGNFGNTYQLYARLICQGSPRDQARKIVSIAERLLVDLANPAC